MSNAAEGRDEDAPRKRRGSVHAARRVNALLRGLGGTRYLEVGVSRGTTFTEIRADTKVAVDPKFRFDTAAASGPGITYHEITSDDYFVNHAQGVFDVIFLDGLHRFEQTFRDVCASMRHAHAGTVWLIDDTVPLDIYSTHRNQRQAVRYRKEAGGESGAWHGDIYKVVFAVANFFPNLSYATIEDRGNPQTLLWKMPRADFSPKIDSLEAISRMDWFELQTRMRDLRLMPEPEALKLAIDGAKQAAKAFA